VVCSRLEIISPIQHVVIWTLSFFNSCDIYVECVLSINNIWLIYCVFHMFLALQMSVKFDKMVTVSKILLKFASF
jgi:hypothetical protein